MDDPLLALPRGPLYTNLLGAYAIAKVLERAIETGIDVFQPLIECRYDLVLDDGLKL